MSEKSEEGLTLDKRTMDVLVANIIPTSKYFEVRFDHMQGQIDDIRGDIKDFRSDVDKRFDDIKTDMDKRFDAVKTDMDKRFEQVDKRFEQVIASIDRLGDKLEHRDEKQRAFTLSMFTIAISISILGALGAFLKSLGVI
jgi:nitrate/nitrite-specific signal transduction histidine kinase